MGPWRYLVTVLLLVAVGRTAAAEDVIYAVPNGDYRLLLQEFEPQAIRGPDGNPISGRVVGLREAMAMAWPGVTIQLLPGRYTQDSPEEGILFPHNGSPDRPITLRGMGSDTVIVGTKAGVFSGRHDSVIAGMAKSLLDTLGVELVRKTDEVSLLLEPDYRGGSICFRFKEKQWIVLDNLTLDDCADAGVDVIDSQYITLKNSIVVEGLYAFFAKGSHSHHLLVENNIWIQDSTRDMWSRVHWCEYKYGDLRGQAGALFAGLDVAGDVIVRRNRVEYAFNAVRMDISSAKRRKIPKKPSSLGRLNTNVEVYDNDFSFIRDNVLEPEYDATNWWFHGNRIRNAHAWFSFDGLWGGRWYLYDNVGWFDDRPSRECAANDACKHWAEQHPKAPEECNDPHDGGRVFKFRPDARYAPGPLYIFNNSWYLRASVIKDGRLGYIGHWNNAIDFCRPEDYPDGLCEGVKPFFNGFMWDNDNYAFGHDLSNHPDFPTGLRAQGYRVSGISVPPSQPLFVDAARGNFTLVDGSPGRGAGCVVAEDERGLLECHDPTEKAPGPDIGAPADITKDDRVDFIHYDGGLYKEPPRIVRVDLPAATKDAPPLLRLAFSVPVVLMASDLRAELDYGGDAGSLQSEPCQATGRFVTCEFAGSLPAATLTAVRLPDAIVGYSGELATTWGSVSDLVRLMR